MLSSVLFIKNEDALKEECQAEDDTMNPKLITMMYYKPIVNVGKLCNDNIKTVNRYIKGED